MLVGVFDRIAEFKKSQGIKAICKGPPSLEMECSGNNKNQQIVKFKCDGNGCEYIANWLW